MIDERISVAEHAENYGNEEVVLLDRECDITGYSGHSRAQRRACVCVRVGKKDHLPCAA